VGKGKPTKEPMAYLYAAAGNMKIKTRYRGHKKKTKPPPPQKQKKNTTPKPQKPPHQKKPTIFTQVKKAGERAMLTEGETL